jgi:folate-binding protein YgfZ
MPLFDLSARTKLRLSGADRLRFLNGQVTNDVRKASTGRAQAACVVNAKGKVDAFVYIASEADAFLIDADPEVRENLAQRLERYIIADDVNLEDVTEAFALFHLTEQPKADLPDDWSWRESRRFATPGWDLFRPAEEHDRTMQLLLLHYSLCDNDCAERLRIELGLPRWGRELTNDIIPVEANLESEAIDYAKGCYIGQEVISRMKISGQTNKRLSGLVSISGQPLTPAMKLHPVSGSADAGREVGWITSATRSDRLEKAIALGYVKRGFNAVGTQLEARDPVHPAASGELLVEVVELPFR